MVGWCCHCIAPISSPFSPAFRSLGRGVGVGYSYISYFFLSPSFLFSCTEQFRMMSKYIEPWSRRRFCLSQRSGLPVPINKANKPCPGESKLQFGPTGMTPKIFFCSWPMLQSSKRPSRILTRFAPLCSTQYRWRVSLVPKTTEPSNLQRAVSKDYTSE